LSGNKTGLLFSLPAVTINIRNTESGTEETAWFAYLHIGGCWGQEILAVAGDRRYWLLLGTGGIGFCWGQEIFTFSVLKCKLHEIFRSRRSGVED
jgi:hypothetical protein